MNVVDIRRYEMLVRVRDFGAAHPDLFPPSTVGGQAFAAVATAVANLSQHAATQLSGRGSAREGTTSKAVAREGLRDDLDAIVRTARALALDMPGLDDKFRPPRGSGDQSVLNAARAFVQDAEPMAKQFIEHGLEEDFIAELQHSIADFEEAMRDHEAGKDVHVASRVAIETSMEAGLDAVKRLDAVVPNKLRDDSATMAVWERARRVEYPTSRARAEKPASAAKPAESEAATPPAAAATASAGAASAT